MNWRLALSLALVAVLLTACGSAASPAAGGDAPTAAAATGSSTATNVLKFAVSGMDENRYDSLIDAFEAENPDVHISTVSIEQLLQTGGPGSDWPADAYLRLAAAADVIAAPATRAAVQQGALLDLTQFFESDPNLKPDAFYPGLLESVQWEGKTWSVPVEASYSPIYYDKKLFDAAGLAYPQPGWTWDDFLATAQALTVGSGDTVSQWGFVEPTFDPVTWVQARAGLLVDPDTYPPTAHLDSAAVAEAVRWYTDLFLTHKVSPYYSTSEEGGPEGMFRDEGMRLLAEGGAAMWFSGGSSVGGRGLRGMVSVRMAGPGGPGGPEEESAYGAVPFPVDQAGDHSTPAVVDGLSISAGTRKADLAWKWISYLAQQQGGQRGPFNAVSTGTIPALPSVAAAAGVWDGLDADVAAALQYAIDHATIDNSGGVGLETFYAAVVDVMDNGTALETALANAQAKAEAEIEAAVAAAPTPVADLVVAEDEQKALSAGAVLLDFGMSEGPGRFGQQSYAALVDEFQAAHPDILVEIDTPQGFRGGLDLADMAAEYDCFQASPDLNDDSVAAVVNLEPFLAADSSARKEDFFPSVLEQFTYQGQLWGLPSGVTVNLMSYNKDLFDAAGLDYPSLDWTWSDFLAAAVALTQGEGEAKQYGYAPGSFGTSDLVSMLDRLGADMLDESVTPPRLTFTTPSVVDALRSYAGLATEYGVEPDYEEAPGPGGGEGERQSLIDQGRVAMWMEASGGFFVARGGQGGTVGMAVVGPGGDGGQSNLNTGVVPLPAGPDSAQGSGFQSADGYFISAQSDARQACWTWITFLTQQADAASGLPARQSVAQSDAYRQRVGAEQADAMMASVNSGGRASFFQRISDEGNWLGFASFWLSDAYDRVVAGEMTVEESLAAAQESVDAFRDCIIAKDAYQDPSAMGQCLSESGAFAPERP